MKPLQGQCLCGAVRISIDARDVEPVDACHCAQCRAWSGHFWASVNAPVANIAISDDDGALRWHRSSEHVRRGFCGRCGSSLFYHADKIDHRKDRMSVSLGALDQPTGLRLAEHIFVAEKGDYYEIADGLPQRQGWNNADGTGA
ncbi:MAG: GFA family protein [Pseudomonadota bacterium]